MFEVSEAFNQPLAFNTTEVTNVRGIYFFEVLLLQLKQQILTFHFPPNLLLDGVHVWICSSFQSTTSFQYWQGYKCERHILVCRPSAMREQILISHSPPNLLSDGVYVYFCGGLQSGPASFRRLFQPDQFGGHIFELWMQYQKGPDQCNWAVVCLHHQFWAQNRNPGVS